MDRQPSATRATERHPVVTRAAWTQARLDLLAREKELTRLRDDISRQRRALPWVRIDKTYAFDGPDGRETLPQLFAGRSQLIVYHFMFAPDWEAGCKSCSFWADNFNGILAHVNQRDATFVAVSRAPQAKLQAFAKRLGWSFKWLTSLDDFNYDFRVCCPAKGSGRGTGREMAGRGGTRPAESAGLRAAGGGRRAAPRVWTPGGDPGRSRRAVLDGAGRVRRAKPQAAGG